MHRKEKKIKHDEIDTKLLSVAWQSRAEEESDEN
jgi:hypothetical protein